MYQTLFIVSVLLLGIHCAEQSKFSIFQKGCDMDKCELDVGKLTLTVCVAFMLEDIQLVV